MNTDSLKRLWKTVFGDSDAFLDAFFRIAYSPQRCSWIEENEEAICALYWFDCEFEGGKLAYIYAVATHPQHRGKGLASRLLLQTHERLKALGYAGVVLKPAEGLFPFYERLGYKTSGYIRRFSAEANANPATMKHLSPEEYGQLRRSYLPESGIRQEGVTLDFLGTFAAFYASEDALVCVAKDEPLVFEYLGDPHSAPGVLAFLSIKTAEIPTWGNELPFAMYCPLNCTKTPGYLGLSLE